TEMVKKIHLKLLRDTKASWMQFGAVALIITLGVAIFITSYAAYKNLDSSYEYTFQQLNMADYWISVDNLPPKAVKEIDEIPGVAAQGRIVGDVVLDLAPIYRGERVLGRVVSLPRYGNTAINNVQVTSGSYFSSDSGREILMEKRFAEYHKMNPGDWLTIERENSKLRFRISGIATSPEYIWVARSAQDMMPSPRTFGILFMSQPGAESLFGMTGGTNEIIMTVAAGVDRKAVLDEVRNILRKNGIKRLTSKDEPVTVETRRADIFQGVRTAYMVERKDQLSNRLLKMDLDGFREMAVLFPTLFLSVAALAIYTLLSRLVESQRVQIGLMRALGYSRRSVLMHFLGFALLVGILGSVSGAILGSLMANALTVEYAKQLKIPFIIISPPWSVVLTGIITGIMVPVAAGIIPAWATAGMRPAQAM
ncbi:MAG: FtsX-like permease family protein, partial [Dehalococcoidia bacterium]|nr:FtsX-like permease family protein [Dehalococcoidia bacterium]